MYLLGKFICPHNQLSKTYYQIKILTYRLYLYKKEYKSEKKNRHIEKHFSDFGNEYNLSIGCYDILISFLIITK